MKNFFQNIFSFFFEKKDTDSTPVVPEVKKYPLGVLPDDVDVRRIPYTQVYQPVPLPIEYRTDVSMFPDFDQGLLGTCVAHAFAFAKMVLDFIETRVVVIYSRRFLYVLARRFSGFTENIDAPSNQGLFPRIAIKVLTVVGLIKETTFDDNNLPHSKYVNDFVVTDAMRKEAITGQAGGFSFPDNTSIGLKQAVYRSKIIPITIGIDWSCIDPDGTVHAPKRIVGTHEVVLLGWEVHNAKERFIFKNWWTKKWGTNGFGYINADEVEKVVVDSVAITDIPNDLVERAKNTQYIFLSDLKLGMQNESVLQMQKRLVEYGVAEFKQPTGYFGQQTLTALMQFQELKGLPVTGFFGSMSRDAMNGDVAQGKVKAKLDLWLEAIIKMEGSNPKWNNPGNLRYVGQAKAVGKTPNGFCIFPDYATGYMEMRNLLLRACTGQSKNYSPTMTLFEFYAGVYNTDGTKKYPGYAPKEDNNDPVRYANFVAKVVGVSPSIQIKDLLL